jgi:hypothetical protein
MKDAFETDKYEIFLLRKKKKKKKKFLKQI